jgi:histidinol-phosphate aminotransferase
MGKYRTGLEMLKSYSVEEKEWDVKLDANENANNLPPLVQERLISRLSFLPFNRYPDSNMLDLRTQIAQSLNLTIDNVLIGNGSSEILQSLCHAFGGAGRSIVFPNPSFSMYAIYAQLADSQPVSVSLEEDFSLSRDKLLKTAEQVKASLVILCNPNNPTGNVMPPEDIEYIVAHANCPVVVDEAYYEFYGQSAVRLLGQYSNLIVARTFSKAYGMAAARIGYMLAANEITAMVGKVMMPYHVNALSLVAAEVICQMRDEFVLNIKQTLVERNRLAVSLECLPGVKVYPSETNFLLIRINNADALTKLMADQGIAIRDFGSAPGLTDCLRITVGTPLENEAVLQVMKKWSERR